MPSNNISGSMVIETLGKYFMLSSIALVYSLFLCNYSWSAVLSTKSCSAADIREKISKAKAGDLVIVPSGTCSWTDGMPGDQPNTHASVVINKSNVTLQGAGIGRTIINTRYGGGRAGGGIIIQRGTRNVRVTGFTFDGGSEEKGIYQAISIGGWATRDGAKDFRIDHNRFQNYGALRNGGMGQYVVESWGFSYGVIDHNEFVDTRGEVLYFSGDGTPAFSRTPEVGGYENGTIFVEDNTFTMLNCNGYRNSHECGNVIDGNEGARYVFRYNTVSGTADARWNQVIDTHGFCVCDHLCAGGIFDIRSIVSIEAYANNISIGRNGNDRDKGWLPFAIRAGSGVIYDNFIYGKTGSIKFVNERSQTPAYGCMTNKHATPPYSKECHVANGSGIVEGAGPTYGSCRDQVHDFYFWNNKRNGSTSDFNNGVYVENSKWPQPDILQDVHFFSEKKKPGYTPYPYPHPRTTRK
jgi:hypothetical protein